MKLITSIFLLITMLAMPARSMEIPARTDKYPILMFAVVGVGVVALLVTSSQKTYAHTQTRDATLEKHGYRVFNAKNNPLTPEWREKILNICDNHAIKAQRSDAHNWSYELDMSGTWQNGGVISLAEDSQIPLEAQKEIGGAVCEVLKTLYSDKKINLKFTLSIFDDIRQWVEKSSENKKRSALHIQKLGIHQDIFYPENSPRILFFSIIKAQEACPDLQIYRFPRHHLAHFNYDEALYPCNGILRLLKPLLGQGIIYFPELLLVENIKGESGAAYAIDQHIQIHGDVLLHAREGYTAQYIPELDNRPRRMTFVLRIYPIEEDSPQEVLSYPILMQPWAWIESCLKR